MMIIVIIIISTFSNNVVSLHWFLWEYFSMDHFTLQQCCCRQKGDLKFSILIIIN